MLKKTITYTNFNDETVTEDFYFNLSKSEVAEMELSRKGGLSEYLQTIIQAEDPQAIISTFREIILMSVGERSADGRLFTKSLEIKSHFLSCGAYDEIFMELVTNGEAGAEFINGIVPKNLNDSKPTETVANDTLNAVKRLGFSENSTEPSANGIYTTETGSWSRENAAAQAEDTRPAWIREDRDPTEAELRAMGKDELLLAMRRKSKSLGSVSDGSAL